MQTNVSSAGQQLKPKKSTSIRNHAEAVFVFKEAFKWDTKLTKYSTSEINKVFTKCKNSTVKKSVLKNTENK